MYVHSMLLIDGTSMSMLELPSASYNSIPYHICYPTVRRLNCLGRRAVLMVDQTKQHAFSS